VTRLGLESAGRPIAAARRIDRGESLSHDVLLSYPNKMRKYGNMKNIFKD
jgi:hypothetical protein